MRASYAVTWEGDHARRSGRLELGADSLVFHGSNGDGSVAETVGYRELTGVRIARSPAERLSGRPTLVLDRRTGSQVRIAGIAQPGIISELADCLSVLQLAEEPVMGRVVVVLPLKEDSSGPAGALLEEGPPFDPDAAGLERHQVFLTDNEVVFVFEADDADAVERLAGDASLWAAAEAWKELVAGPPRIASEVYSWVRPHPPDDVSFEPTPGPGDSEGGDLY